MNPWLENPLDDYERHMALPTVGQGSFLADTLEAPSDHEEQSAMELDEKQRTLLQLKAALDAGDAVAMHAALRSSNAKRIQTGERRTRTIWCVTGYRCREVTAKRWMRAKNSKISQK
jgi:hypothetical protein